MAGWKRSGGYQDVDVIRQVRLFTGEDGQSHVEESVIDAATGWLAAAGVRFQQNPAGSRLDLHVAPRRQYVIRLTGKLEFTTRDGAVFGLGPGDVLLAEDMAGGGHRWRLVDDQPWTRVYIQLP
jgi:hypothetical protein